MESTKEISGAEVKRILVVDDNDNIRELYKKELEEEGYEVVPAAGGKEAMDFFERESFDLVMLDIKMPDVGGLEVLGKIRDKDKSLPVILLTAYSTYEQDFSSWAADEYIVKSADLTELKDVLRKYLAG